MRRVPQGGVGDSRYGHVSAGAGEHTEVMSQDRAYGRVTNPERFATLHDAVHELVASLRQRFDVLVVPMEPEGDDPCPKVLSTVRVSPRNDGASVTISLTSFPGLYVRFGAKHTERFPDCGCDACNEQIEELAENLREKVLAVAAGRFSETDGGYAFVFEHGEQSGRQPRRRFRRESPTRHYEPWPLLGADRY